TIMTDPELAERTYVEPLTVEVLERVIAREKPDALLPTLGGQTALNLSLALAEAGILEKYGVKLIGASVEAIEKAEDRELFKAAMARIGLEVPRSGYAHSLKEAREIQQTFGFPAILRPSFTLGGMGGGIAYSAEEFDENGGSNVQFAVNPEDGRMVIVEMNPRVSRSSALASKATGFPIAKIAAKLAVGYTLDEIRNDITRETPASFEPTIDYIVTKVPRFAFEKFPGADGTLTTQMKSVG